MKILQVVTYISPDGAYGGPVRVAINQAKALTEQGHTVMVAAAAGGFKGPLPEEFDGFPVHLFPAHRAVPKSGFAGITSPSMLTWFMRAVRNTDVVHVHLARDLVTLPAAAIALLAEKPLVVQTHGMITHTNKRLAVPLDRILTVPVLRMARKVLFLTERERADLISVAGNGLELEHLPNGTSLPSQLAIEQTAGPQANPEVLYLARLHPRKRPMMVVAAAGRLKKVFKYARFSIVGPDEGEGSSVRESIDNDEHENRLSWTGPIAPGDTLERMMHASIYVLPSVDEPFPMSVLEAMSIGLPVIVTDSCGLAAYIQGNKAGIVCDPSLDSFTLAIENLLKDNNFRIEAGCNARKTIGECFSMQAIAKKLNEMYNGCLP